MNGNRIAGFLLVLFGGIILLDNLGYDVFRWYYIRSYGFLLIGIILFVRGYLRPDKSGIFVGSFIFLIGGYYLLALLDFYYLARGLTISSFTIAFGLSFYSLFFFKSREWGYLLYGNLILLVGLFFWLIYKGMLPVYLVEYGVESYWPILLVLIGIILIINSMSRQQKKDSSESQ